jgi:hypothetical protein
MTDPNAEKRVALAKDVLAKLAAKELSPYFGAYAVVDKKGCRVCALGSLMVACCGAPESPTQADDVIRCLTPLFSLEELAIIEAAFEGDNDMPLSDIARGRGLAIGEQLTGAASVFGTPPEESYDGEGMSAADRIHDIMLNIVRHDGRFVPEDL